MALSCHDPTLLKAQQVQLYITGLGDPLQTDGALQQLATLDDAVIFMRAYEQRNASQETAMQQPCPTGRAFSRPASQPQAHTSTSTLTALSASVNKPVGTTIRRSPSEIAQRRKEDKCFHCDDFFTQGHKQLCKQLFSIEVVEDSDTDDVEPTISLHALTGIQPRSGRIMQLAIIIKGARFIALLDSGSTHNFLNTEAAARVGIPVSGPSGLWVMVTNGDKLASPGCCKALSISIHGKQFQLD
jgi:hypothetical protein